MPEAPWLEMELASHLAPVEAPDSLWERIQEPPRRAPKRPPLWLLWPVAAVLLLALSPWTGDPTAAMERLADQELRAGAESLDFRSSSLTEIRRWVKAKTNLDLDAPDQSTGAVRILGARLIRIQGAPAAAVAYQVGSDPAILLVSSGSNTAPKHVFRRILTLSGAKLLSWTMRQQVYTMAFPVSADPQAGCLLCHASGRTLTSN